MSVVAAVPDSTFDRRRHPQALEFSRWAAPDGWDHRAYRWRPRDPRAPRGSLLFQSGRADFIEKYIEACDHWWRSGWGVEGFDWRGQGGSGRLGTGGVDHRESFDPLIEDLAVFIADWRARTPAPHVLVAHSMGGHVALRLCAERGVTLDGLVLVAPMLALHTRPVPLWLARALVGAMTRTGGAHRLGRERRSAGAGRQARLTADRARFEDSVWWKQADPTLGLGNPSWGWIRAALEGARRLEAPGLLEGVRTPVLMLAGGRDRLVSAPAIRAAARRLPDARVSLFPNARHELLREADRDRLAAMAAIDRFFDERAPQPAGHLA
jgi:lysophospholipase